MPPTKPTDDDDWRDTDAKDHTTPSEKKPRAERKSPVRDDDDSDHDDDKIYSDSDETDDGDASDLEDDPVDLATIASRLGPLSARHRRSVVSSYVPLDTNWTPPVHPKSPTDEAAIRRSVRRNVLFANVSEETLEILVQAMTYVAVPRGQAIIRQGAAGDLFYILDSGRCDVEIHGRCVDHLDGTSDRNFFGELALLYDAPRAATIRATTDVECWSLDRLTFRRVLMDTTIKQRKLHLAFVEQVPIFSTLSGYERMIVADALRVEYFDSEAVILREGTAGDDFYLIEDGEVRCTRDGDEVSARLGAGDFFGELALITDDVRMATVTAVRKTKCLVLDRNTFKRLLGPMQEHLRKRADLYELYMKAKPIRAVVH